MVAFLVPVTEGVKVTLNVAVPPAATEVGTELTTKSEAFAPLETIDEIAITSVPVFWMV